MTSDRHGEYFMTGSRVRDIYSEKFGTVVSVYVMGIHTSPRLTVLFDGEESPVNVRPICLEIVGMSGGKEKPKKTAKEKGEYVNA